MPLLIVLIGIIVLLILMIHFKINGLISLIVVSLFVGIMEGMPILKVTKSIYNGVGGQLSSIALIVAFGAMFSKMLDECGAGQRIAMTLVQKFGLKRIQWAMMITAFILGITMFYEPAFVLLIPIVYSISSKTKVPLIVAGFPMSVGLSVTQCFLPPHPGPTAVVNMYNASVGKTLLLGIIIAIPAALIVGILFSKTKLVRNAKCSIPEGLTAERVFSDEEMPSFSSSLSIALVPVVLMAFNTFAEIILPKTSKILVYTAFFGDAPIALLIAVLISMIVLGIRRGKDSDEIMKSFSEGVKSVAMIILIIGAGGAFKQVIVDAGVANYIKNIVGSLNVSPLILAWSIAATLRICIGSATVSVNAAAGIVLPLLSLGNVNPELMVLATASGSCICSHVNDPGFWMFKEYFNMPLSDAFRTRSTYTTILSLCGLAGVLILNIFI